MTDTEIKKYKSLVAGERAGIACTVCCACIFIAAIIMFTVGALQNNEILKIFALAVCPVIMLLCIAASAYCYFTYGRQKEKMLKAFVSNILIENASALRSDRSSLSYTITVEKGKAYLKANDFKNSVVFDFTPLGKNAVGASEIALTVTGTLSNTFCRLYDRGAEYKSVSYRLSYDGKTKKTVPVITDGVPDKNAYKAYLKKLS